MLNTYPKLATMKSWPLERVQAQRDKEREDYRNHPDESYHASISRHYRLGYMRWLLNGAPKPQPSFV